MELHRTSISLDGSIIKEPFTGLLTACAHPRALDLHVHGLYRVGDGGEQRDDPDARNDPDGRALWYDRLQRVQDAHVPVSKRMSFGVSLR